MTALWVDQPAALVDPVILEAGALADAGVIDPETIPCLTCEVPAVGHGDDLGHAHEVPPAYVLAQAALASQDRTILEDVADYLQAGYTPSGKGGPRVSDAGACRRQIQYRERPPAGYVPRTDIDVKAATLGQIVHQAGELARAARYPWKRVEMTIDIPGLQKPGRVDEYDPVLGVVADTKSAGRGKWSVVGAEGPTESMWKQLRIYGYALDAAGWPVKTLKVTAINRDSGDEEVFYEAYDPARGVAALDELAAVDAAIQAGVDMPRDGYGPADWRCQWCPALEHCWDTKRATELGRHPRSLVLLGEKPEDPTIVWAGLELLEAAATRLAAEKVEARAKELVEGIEKGLYGAERADGGIEIGRKPNTSMGYKKAHAELVALYALAFAGDEKAPAPDALPEVPKSVSYSTTVKRQRKAKTSKRKSPKTPAAVAAELVESMIERNGR